MVGSIVDNLNYLAENIPWGALAEGVLASGFLSIVLAVPYRYIKRWFTHYKEVMIIFVGAAGVIFASANYILTTPSTDPGIVALQGLAIAWGTQPFYRIMVKPLFTWIVSRVKQEIEKAAQLNLDIKSAAQPVVASEDVLQLSTTETPVVNTVVDDFSH